MARLPPPAPEPCGVLIYGQHSKWSGPKAQLIKDESEVTFDVVGSISHYSRAGRFTTSGRSPFPWSYSGLIGS